MQSNRHTARMLGVIALLGAGSFAAFLLSYHFARPVPGERAYSEGLELIREGAPSRAVRHFEAALDAEPDNVAALKGLAAAETRTGRLRRALDALNQVLRLTPEDACAAALRGIVHDRLEQPRAAIADYRAGVAGCRAARERMSWLERMLGNVQEVPPSVADRLAYLESQMALTPAERQLYRPPGGRDDAGAPPD